MESDIALTGISIVVLVVIATAKSALDEMSDVSLRMLASDSDETHNGKFWRTILNQHHQLSFTLTFGIHLSIASIAIFLSSIAYKLTPDHFLITALLSILLTVVLFRQIVPLILTQNDPTRTLMHLRIPLSLFWPVFGAIVSPLYRALRGLQRERIPKVVDDDETEDDESGLKAFLDVGEEEGIIEENEGEMIQSIIRFGDRTVGEVMTPRTRIVSVDAQMTLDEVRDMIIQSKYSRLPVYRDTIDNIEGVIYVRDLLKFWQNGETFHKAYEIARPTYFVPDSKPIDELLKEMQKAKTPMAIVIDEYGSLAGLATIEDLIEEIVGEIEDEDEYEEDELDADIIEQDNDVFIVRGEVEIAKIERKYDVEIAADDFSTVAGFVINQLGRLPLTGETLIFHPSGVAKKLGLMFEILETDEKRVTRVKIMPVSLVI